MAFTEQEKKEILDSIRFYADQGMDYTSIGKKIGRGADSVRFLAKRNDIEIKKKPYELREPVDKTTHGEHSLLHEFSSDVRSLLFNKPWGSAA